ncbi:response regulator, partial [bacterium]|nr:response regulator [bacterium]
EIVVAMNGKSCLELVNSKNPPDLILLDIMMPEMDGHEVIISLQADVKTRDIPIIFISALATAEDESLGLALGAVDYITKPFNNAIIKARVTTHLKLKKQREIMIQQQQELQKADKLKAFEVMAGGLAHDFNNLLTSIIGNLELAMMDLQPEEETYKSLENALCPSLLAKDLAAKFLTISQGYQVKGERLQLEKTINQVVKSMPTVADIKFEIKISDPTWTLKAAQVHIVQLLKNILLNSQEAMPAGGTISITVSSCPDGLKEHLSLTGGSYLKISVRDQGEGISAENYPKIFDPYFSTKPMGVQKGMGLGLTICHSIIKKHQGQLEIKSVPGQGTVVEIYLPLIGEVK